MPDEFDLVILREAVSAGRIHWHKHALERLLERGLSRKDVLGAIMDGEVIEIYPKDRPYPSCLILHPGVEPMHVVAAADSIDRICHVITTYRPDVRFEPDFRTRKKDLDE